MTSSADKRPILFIGDIQGCSGELAELLLAAGFEPGRHRLIPAGDTINRGPDAPGVLRQLREHGAEPIVGNHELAFMARADALPVEPPSKGGSAWEQLTGAGMLEEALAWIRGWPVLRQEDDWIAVHAGLHPVLPPDQTPAAFLTEVRYCTRDGQRPSVPEGTLTKPPPGFRPWYEFYRGPRTVVFGHWARMGLIRRERLFGLDTGCVYGRMLTGLWWPEGRIVQVPSHQPPRFPVLG